MKKFLIGLSAVAMISFGATSCSDKNNDEPGNGDINFGGGSGTMEEMTPEESKEYISDAASEALNLINPQDQKQIIDLGVYFVDNYADLEFPGNFYDDEDFDSGFMADYFKATAKGFAQVNGNLITKAVADYVYDINFKDFTGIYQAGIYEWERVGDSQDVVFKFDDQLGQPVVLTVKGSSNSYSNTVEWTEEDWDYNYGYYDETYQANVTIPSEITVTLTAGGTQLLSAVVNSNVDLKNQSAASFTADVEVNGGNLKVNAKTSGNNNQISETSTVYVGGSFLVGTEAVVKGNDLCNINYYESLDDTYEDDDEIFQHLFKSATCQANLINKINVDYGMTNAPGLLEALEMYADDAEEAQTIVDLLNKNMKGQIRFNNTTTVQATLLWTAYEYNDSWGYYNYYEIMPLLYFPADDTTYEFEEYFENGFSGVTSMLESLVRKYQAIIDAAN